MWETCNIEKITEKALKTQLGESQGAEKFGRYTTARKCLVEEILQEIKAVQPTLTDHGPDHIRHVLNNIEGLLGSDVKKLSGIELYCLITSALFHDVGNIFSREEHQKNINAVYKYVHPDCNNHREEQKIMLKVVAAHCGDTGDGSKDTLKRVDNQLSLDGKPVRVRQIAAILRFADELAEGKIRTSHFMLQQHSYPQDSVVYHKYAQITSVNIDRGNERIALTYHINIKRDGDDGWLTSHKEDDLCEIIKYTSTRIMKLHQERQYARYYSEFILPFKKTTVSFDFWIDDHYPLDLGLQNITLTDLIVPGDFEKKLEEYYPNCRADIMLSNIREEYRKTRAR